jgi:CheY-like chemotaxis protein/putative methionine-R-sulfoxide reductase with GAF domain
MDTSDIEHMLALLPQGEGGLPGLLRRLAAEVRRILDADVCRVWIIDSRERANNGFGLAERVVRQPSERAVPDIHVADPDAIHASLPAQGTIETSRNGRSIARVRLASIGFVEAARTSAPIAPSELAQVRAFVAQLEGEVEARFPAEELESFRHWLRVRGAIDRRAARAFAQVQSIEELAETIDAFSEELTPAEYSGLYFIDPDTGNLRLAYGRGLNAAERAAAEATAMERHPGIVMRTGRVVDVPDTTIERNDGMPSGHGREVRSRLFIPVMSAGGVVGTIGFASSIPHAYTSRHRQILAFLADFAGFSYGRITAQRAMVRRGELLEAANTAAERLLGAQEWEPASYAALALIGSALDANAVALVELSNTAVGSDVGSGSSADSRSNGSQSPVSFSATTAQSTTEPLEFAWQPTFGFPWLRGARIRSLSAQERADLTTDRGIFVDPNDGAPALLLKPVFVESTLWGVIAYEPKPGVARLIDRAERSALRALARAFGAAIARERLAKAVAHQQKMDAVGRLASGVAQDFSQQLWPILLYTEMLERSPGLDDRARQVLGEMRVAARRASELVEQVLAISRQRDRLIDLVHVADIAIEVSHHVRNGAPNSFSVTTSIDADSGCILGDPAQLRDVLLALGLSAIAAHRDRVDRSTPSALRMVVEQAAHDGRDFVRIACEFDNTLADFVTGALVRGEETGELRRVIAEMGGTIALQDGATIEMLLPRVPTDAKTNAGVAGFAGFAVESSGVSSDRSALGSEAARPVSTSAPVTTALEALPKVLFVDDDAAVLEVVREVLDSLGYAVTACRDASAALAQLSSGWLPDIVLTDLTMPGMNGIELAREIRKRGFEMPIVCCTGFLDEASERAGAQAGMCAFVRKPVDCDALDQTLWTAIEKERRLRRRG